MQIYLPIAEVSVNAFLLLGLGGIIGILSGMFGVGGGFLMTPLLFFIGIPPAVAVATGAVQIVASSFSGVLAHLRRKTVDLKMGTVLLVGGLIGAAVGIVLFNYLKSLGQVDLLVNLCYVVFLGIIGGLMFIESWHAIRRSKVPGSRPAAEDEIPRVWFVYFSDPAADHRSNCWHLGRHHGCWRWLRYVARNDLLAGHADQSGHRNVLVPDYFCNRVHDDAACDDKFHS
jgi:hypothetical protein